MRQQIQTKAMEQKALRFLCSGVEVGMLGLSWTTRWQSHIMDDSGPFRASHGLLGGPRPGIKHGLGQNNCFTMNLVIQLCVYMIRSLNIPLSSES